MAWNAPNNHPLEGLHWYTYESHWLPKGQCLHRGEKSGAINHVPVLFPTPKVLAKFEDFPLRYLFTPSHSWFPFSFKISYLSWHIEIPLCIKVHIKRRLANSTLVILLFALNVMKMGVLHPTYQSGLPIVFTLLNSILFNLFYSTMFFFCGKDGSYHDKKPLIQHGGECMGSGAGCLGWNLPPPAWFTASCLSTTCLRLLIYKVEIIIILTWFVRRLQWVKQLKWYLAQ